MPEQGQPGRWWDTQGKDGTSIPTAACAALTLKVFASVPTSSPSSQANFNTHMDDDKSRQA